MDSAKTFAWRMHVLAQIASAVVVGACAVSTFAQDVADKPDLRVGDTWIFHATGENDGKPVDYMWQRRIDAMLPGDRIRVSPRYSTDEYDTSRNPVYRDRPNFSPADFRFPLRVDAEWSYASPVGIATVDGRIFDNHGQMKVVALESITVPKGTFACFRIEGESNWIATVDATQPDILANQKWRITIWYCPEIRNFAKSHLESYRGGAYGRGVYGTVDHELVAYRKGRQLEPPTSPKIEGTGQDAPAQLSRLDGAWEGHRGIWRITARIQGDRIDGAVQCDRNGTWTAKGPSFSGAVANDGSVDADTDEQLQGWSPRRIIGTLPNLSVVAYGKVTCPNGDVAVGRVEGPGTGR